MILSAVRIALVVGAITRAIAPAIALVGAGILYKHQKLMIVIRENGEISWLPIVTFLALLLCHFEFVDHGEK